jgi:hypothetical protein
MSDSSQDTREGRVRRPYRAPRLRQMERSESPYPRPALQLTPTVQLDTLNDDDLRLPNLEPRLPMA